MPFLQKISEAYQICIVSDTDTLMLPDFYKEYPIKLFTSEDYGSYKNDGRNRMFTEVIAYYGVQPDYTVSNLEELCAILEPGEPAEPA
ncbi:hypothetical protein JI735_22460 [Paenibacillus sonchi]|uniref:Uncharacterized protein n=1 Tax=Paenibacillus sonchi TaxID=373687 RepID=A0A974P8I2_9BACL|nr:hypothetical protein [Paenibacillus sonchi]QQZ59402.1 hypothetical protein JI735_22460 [Paenibacillus sonchi]